MTLARVATTMEAAERHVAKQQHVGGGGAPATASGHDRLPPCLGEFWMLATCVDAGGGECDAAYCRVVECLRRHGLRTPADRLLGARPPPAER